MCIRDRVDKATETMPEPEISENQVEEKRKEIKDDVPQQPVNIDEILSVEADDEENDEEQVDSSERIRKMKEMMRKKKRNRRIEDRRVY